MAILNNLIVYGESRLLGKLYCNDINIGNDLTVAGTTYSEGPLHVGKNTAANAKIFLNNKIAMRGTDAWLRINDAGTGETKFSSGVYFGSSLVRTDGSLQVGNNGAYLNISSSAGTIAVPTTFSYTANSSGNVGLKVNGTASIVTGNITTVNSNMINNAGDIFNKNGLIETDRIKSNVWDITSTQNLGGSFYIAPTINVTNGSTFTISSVSGTTITGYLIDTTNITSSDFGGHTWTNNSLIKITGKLTSGNNHYILGTCSGKLTAAMNTTANRINFQITCDASTVPLAGTYTITDGTVMMYNVSGSNKVGIQMTCYGANKYSYIDIYNGSNGDTPVARLGKLNGLETINGMTPTDYGIYTKNGFFKGKIVANGGSIGGWTIGDSYITTSSSRTTYNSTTNTGMTLSYSGSSGGIGAYNSATQNFTLSSNGVLTAVGANIDGSITAREFLALDENDEEGARFDASGFIVKKGGITFGEAGESGFIYLSTEPYGENYPINNSTDILDWKQIIGTKFGIRSDGTLYASNAHIADSIETESLRIGQWTTFDHRLKLCDGEYNISNDTSVQKGKVYFRRVEGGNVLYRIVTPNGNENPNTQNWYELTQTVPTDWLDHKDRYFIAGQYEDDYESINATYTVFGSRYYETTDTVPDSQKVYYQRSGSGTEVSPYIYTAVNNPTGDPSQQSWYELQKLFYEKDMNSPQMIIGKKSDFAVTVDNTQITFWYAHQKVAFINGDRMEIPRSVMLEEMLIGDNKWSWREHEGNLQLKWIGD